MAGINNSEIVHVGLPSDKGMVTINRTGDTYLINFSRIIGDRSYSSNLELGDGRILRYSSWVDADEHRAIPGSSTTLTEGIISEGYYGYNDTSYDSRLGRARDRLKDMRLLQESILPAQVPELDQAVLTLGLIASDMGNPLSNLEYTPTTPPPSPLSDRPFVG
ncbi:MAG: hypothetical protein JW727_06230 [Candidatus Aenigmarchaeota archaeon]|nr:hypothetical protein [Candidatus Aenigmarchaeota archaeon]